MKSAFQMLCVIFHMTKHYNICTPLTNYHHIGTRLSPYFYPIELPELANWRVGIQYKPSLTDIGDGGGAGGGGAGGGEVDEVEPDLAEVVAGATEGDGH